MLHILANVADYLQTIYIYAFGILFYAKQLISTRFLDSDTTSGATEKKKKTEKCCSLRSIYTADFFYSS